MLSVQVTVEAAVKQESTRSIETQHKRAGLSAIAISPRQQVIETVRAGGVEGIIADHRVIVGVIVDPLHGFSGTDCDRHRRKAVLFWDGDGLDTLMLLIG